MVIFCGFVVNEDGEPLAGVDVRTLKGKARAQTDSRGYYELDQPFSPPQPPHRRPLEDLIFQRAGYKTKILRNNIVFDGTAGGFRVELERGSGIQEKDNLHKLLRDTPLDDDSRGSRPPQ